MIGTILGMFGLNPMELIIIGLVCLGPLAVFGIVAVVVLTRQKSAAPLVTCRNCGQIISSTDKFCRQCGQAVG